MIHKTLHIKSRYEQRESQSHRIDDLNTLKDALLNTGYEGVIVRGAFLDKFSIGFHLYVDDDVVSFFSYYLYLEELLLTSSQFEHHAYLSEGQFCTNAEFNYNYVNLKIEYCPALDNANLIIYTETLTTNEYMWWWRGIACDLLDAALKR
jgi:hypothetical protein